MNLKEIEGKILDLSYKHDNEITLAVDDIIEIIRQAVKQVVESVPVKRKSTEDVIRTDYNVVRMDYNDGYNRHVQKIKRWKEKVLKELERQD